MIPIMINRLPILLLSAAAIASASAPARAQTPAGPLAPARTLVAAQLRARVLTRTFAPDPGRELAARVQPSEPHLYFSIPMSAAFAFAGAAVGYGATFVGLDCSDEGPECGAGPDNGEYAGAYLGMATGAALGAHIGGTRHDSDGSFWASLGGAALGALPLLLSDKESDNDINSSTWLSLGTSTAGAVLMDYLVRRPRHRPQD
ncbi:MAG TPA: hypothetical protein VF771_21495 [Longimicrobiaceae bacterium]